ncbi:MAG: hypothetical protein N2449_05455 [Bacteroidales bacterium]|nr:hypothetical protein [Bacteroidales bacterium]
MKRMFYFFTALILLNSCSQRLMDFTIVSTKNVDLSKAGTFTRGKMRTEGKDLVHMIIYIPIGIPNMKEAIDKAIEKVPGAVALVDGVLYHKSFWFLVYGQTMYVVEGTPLIDPSLAETKCNNIPEYLVVKFNSKGDIAEYKEINKEEYNEIKNNLIKNVK